MSLSRAIVLLAVVLCLLLSILGGAMLFRSVSLPYTARQPDRRRMREAALISLITSLCLLFLILSGQV